MLDGIAGDLDETLLELERLRYEESLLEFFQRAWIEIDPAPLRLNWHHECYAVHLEAVVAGEIRRLVVNVPPRSTKPVAEDEPVLERSKGLVPLKEISVGDEVWTHRGRWQSVLEVHEQGELEVLKLRTRRGREVLAAPDHPFLTPDGWVPLGQLRTDDVIGVVPCLEMCGAETVSLEEARLLGYLVGDGHCGGTPNVTCNSDAIAKDVAFCAQTLGLVPVEQKYTARTRRISLRVSLHGNHGGRGKKGYMGPVRLWLNKHGLDGQSSYNKSVPDSILRGNNDIVRSFLGAYWSCDGFISLRGVKRDGTERDDLLVGCDSVNPQMLSQIQLLLTRLGICSSIRKKVNSRLSTKKQGNGYTSYHLALSSQDAVWRFANLIELHHEKNERLKQARLRRFDFDRSIWGEIVDSITPAGTTRCRCLLVAEDSSFVANGFAVHNTLMFSVIFPAWVWARRWRGPLSGAQTKFMCISYGQTLSTEIATAARRLIQSEWYQRMWGDRVHLYEDEQRIDRFANTAGGFRIATSMTGATLGRGADIRIIDDALSIEQAESKLERERVNRVYSEALQTRETDPATSAEIIIMQRLGEDDLTGYVLSRARDDLVHVMLPMRHDSTRHCTTDWYDDPREEDGELLWPEQFPEEIVQKLEASLGPYASSGQFQQSPTPRGGGIFKREWIEGWPPLRKDGSFPAEMVANGRIMYPAFEYLVAWVDTALTSKEESDFSAMAVLGVFRGEGNSRIEKRADGTYVRVAEDEGFPKALLVAGWMKRLTLHGPPEERPADITDREWNGPKWRAYRQRSWGLCEHVIDTCDRYKVDHLGIETQGQGAVLESELRRLHADRKFTVEVSPARGDKVARAYSVQHLFSSRQIYFPMFEDGSYPSWLTTLADQLFVFPKGQHDDFVDALCHAIRHLRDRGILDRREEHEQIEAERISYRPSQRAAALPYNLR